MHHRPAIALLLVGSLLTAALPAAAHSHGPSCGHAFDATSGQWVAGSSAAARSVGTLANAASIDLSPSQFVVQTNAGTGPTFILNDTGGVGAGTLARGGFEAAAALWAHAFSDPVTIRLDVGFSQLAPNVLGSTGSTANQAPYSFVRGLIAADAKTFADGKAVASLPTGPAISFVSNEPGTCANPATLATCGPIDTSVRVLDADNTFDNNNIRLNTAVVKALGATPAYNAISNPGQRDGAVSFSTLFDWDFDASDGITAGFFDFVGVAAHEIGHALGFVSGVDTGDTNALPFVALPGRAGLDNIAWGTVLDLYRYGDFNGVQTLDWSIGGTPCFSLDNGATCDALVSTGRNNGDGRQASHWKDNLGIGLMDPTFSRGEIGRISNFDLQAFDVIGWDRVSTPSPATLALLGLGFLGVAASRRRRG